jgi:hypothetical protein
MISSLLRVRIAATARITMVVGVAFLWSCGGDSPPPINNPNPPPDSSDCPAFDPNNACAQTCVGLPPINDLGTGFYRGEQGGLYPGGMNVRPATHNADGLAIANAIVPLNASGVQDNVNGSIVFLSVGLSNTQQEYDSFEQMAEALPNKNSALKVVNGAQGGQEINTIIDPNAQFWTNITGILASEGLTNLQVQVIWYKEAEFQPAANAPDTSFSGYVEGLKEKFKTTMNIIHDKFPNAKLCYVASRIYGGYDVTGGNPEPFAYYTGWAVKKLIEEQINGDVDLAYSGSDPKSPWLSWGVYLWADGLRPRSDGLTWICPDDYKPDGRHPSDPIGREKVANLLMDFFLVDETTTPWFLQ